MGKTGTFVPAGSDRPGNRSRCIMEKEELLRCWIMTITPYVANKEEVGFEIIENR